MALKGIKVIEMMGLAPGPLCGTILADFGASVTVVQKIDSIVNTMDVMTNGKKNIKINLKTKEGVQVLNKMCSSSDILIDTYRPGVMEKLGLGPETVSRINPKLIFARLSGYGQQGYYKNKGGHDINYVALSGLLSLLRKNNEPPFIPVNLLADFAGGSLMCVVGILMALLERNNSGKGQIVDCSMTEGAAYLGTWVFKSRKLPIWQGEPGTNLLDGGVPFYATYRTRDNKFMAVGAIEPQFYLNLLQGLELSEDDLPADNNERKEKFQEVFLTKTQEKWVDIFDKIDACVTPVLDIEAVDTHQCNISRNSFYKDSENFIVPEPAPKLSATPAISSGKRPQPKGDENAIEILHKLGYKQNEINELIKKGIVKADKKAKL